MLLEYEGDLPQELRHGDVPSLEEVSRLYAPPGAAFLAWKDADPAGCVVARRRDPATIVLARLFVRPARRGAGIARALVERVERFARDAGYERVVLDTDKDRLAAAHRLYVSLGFAECTPYETVDYGCPTFMQLRLVSEERTSR